jgi:hypothetical protein
LPTSFFPFLLSFLFHSSRNLASNNLTGTLPSTFPESLKVLTLTSNRITSNAWPHFPPSLITLNAANNRLSGDVSFVNSPNLQTLDLTGNNVSSVELAAGGGSIKRVRLAGNEALGVAGGVQIGGDLSGAKGLMVWNVSGCGLSVLSSARSLSVFSLTVELTPL